jgi:hypothetical protein
MGGFDACVIWGFVTECQQIIANCVEYNIPWVFMDMGYWTRKNYYKVTVNARHPDKYIMDRPRTSDRFDKHGLVLKPRRPHTNDGIILLAGMSGKAAWSFGYENEQYERDAIAALQMVSKRPIWYRPKPSWTNARPITGSIFASDKNHSFSHCLARAHCIVTHHSNVAVDGLIEGIPAITFKGAASAICGYDLTKVEHPSFPEDNLRRQFLHNLAYCQYSIEEMAAGTCWRQLKKDGLI